MSDQFIDGEKNILKNNIHNNLPDSGHLQLNLGLSKVICLSIDKAS